ncbi:MAG TPA: nucleoside hydrolase, partial [Terriglobales bacterium]|nr:nucleoside hydrolase [Terriglobales bacterium]
DGTQQDLVARVPNQQTHSRQLLPGAWCHRSVVLMQKGSLCVVICLLLTILASAQQKKIKVLADQDSAGPQGTNFLSLLMLLRAPQIDLMGITTVSGDQWMESATVFALWGVEQAGRADVPVIKGAEMPLLNTPREQELREMLYSPYVGWHGSFNPDAPNPKQTWAPPGGYPKLKPKPGRAADFIADTIRSNPGEVVLYCAGPLTNVALAIRMDPEIVALTKAIYIMGGSSSGGQELNWWWDPEAAAIVLRAPWTKIVVSPFEAGAQLRSSEQLMRRAVQAGGPLANHLKALYLDYQPPPGTSLWSMMWDELMVASIIDPSVIKKSETMYLDVDIDHGPKYGQTVVWKKPEDVPQFFLPYSGPQGPEREKWLGHLVPPPQLHPASVQMEVDGKRFDDIFVELMSH